MSALSSLLKDEITRLAKKVVKQHVAGLQKASASHRHQLAALKRQLVEAEKELMRLRKAARTATPAKAGAGGREVRFVAKGLKPLRTKLGVSAKDFGLLVGVTEQAVYNWETSKSIPRAATVEKIAALRGIGKREARARLESLVQRSQEGQEVLNVVVPKHGY